MGASRLLYRIIRVPSIKSLMDDVRSNGNRVASSENTLSHPALFGVRANTIRAACAKAGNLSSLPELLAVVGVLRELRQLRVSVVPNFLREHRLVVGLTKSTLQNIIDDHAEVHDVCCMCCCLVLVMLSHPALPQSCVGVRAQLAGGQRQPPTVRLPVK